MEKRMLFLDLDGTLLNDEKQITPGNRRALKQTLERGHGVIIATGRPLTSAMNQAHSLGLDKPGCYLIGYNGGVILDWSTGQQLCRKALDMATVQEVFNYVNQKSLHIQTYDDTDVLVEPRCDNDLVREYCGTGVIGFRVIGDVGTGLPKPPVKILMIDKDWNVLEGLRQELAAMLAGRAEVFFSSSNYLEVVTAGVSKGEAVKMLCRLMGVPIENAVAVGDAANDLSMIETAGIGVAMANATDEVKAIANYITACDNNHDGVAEVVEKFFAAAVT